MDIAALSMAMSQANLQTSLGVALMDMSLEGLEVAGADMIDIIDDMELTIDPNLGNVIDICL